MVEEFQNVDAEQNGLAPATEKQKQFIRDLLVRFDDERIEKPTKREASQVITALQSRIVRS